MSTTITRDQFLEFIKTKRDEGENLSNATQHYLEYFDKYQATSQKRNWNWAAFGGSLWCFYRSMYLNGFALAVMLKLAKIFLGVISLVLLSNVLFGKLAYLLFLIIYSYVLMAYGDYMYLKYAERKIAKNKTEGGTSLMNLIILPILLLGFFMFIRPLLLVISELYF